MGGAVRGFTKAVQNVADIPGDVVRTVTGGGSRSATTFAGVPVDTAVNLAKEEMARAHPVFGPQIQTSQPPAPAGVPQEDFNALQQRFDELQGQYSGLQDQYGTVQQDLTGLQNQYGTLQQEYTGLQNEYGVIQDQFGNLRDQYGNLTDQFGNLQQDYSGLQDQYGGLQDQYGGLQDQFGNLQSQFGTVDQQRRQLANQQVSNLAQEQGLGPMGGPTVTQSPYQIPGAAPISYAQAVPQQPMGTPTAGSASDFLYKSLLRQTPVSTPVNPLSGGIGSLPG